MAIVKAKVKNKTNRGQLGVPPKRTANVRVLEDQLHRMVSRGAVEVLGDTQPIDGSEDGPKVEVLDQPDETTRSREAAEGKTPEEIEAEKQAEDDAAKQKAEEEAAKKRAEEEAAAAEAQRGRRGRG